MRCPNCNKFVGYDEPQVEIQSAEISDDRCVIHARVVLNCSECGSELKDAEIEGETDITHQCDEKTKEGEPSYEWEDEPTDGEGTSRQQTKDRHGRPIKSARYMKTFYGFTAEGSVKCGCCGDVIPVSFEGEEQASGFNELV